MNNLEYYLKLKTFHRDDCILLETSNEKPYKSRGDQKKLCIHNGQLKLLFSEIQFLTLFWESHVTSPKVVYAGSAPGDHIPLLSELFPDVEFHLYDPAPFKIAPTTKIHLYNCLFTDEVALSWSNRTDVYLISDIRTADFHTLTKEENEDMIISDLRMQEKWYQLIKPIHALFKFRLPYNEKVVIEKYGENFEYLAGHVFFQVWAPASSTETRLVPTHGKKLWNIKKYESQLFYFNSEVREKQRFYSPFYYDDTPCFSNQTLINNTLVKHINDYDTRNTCQIIIDYVNKFIHNQTFSVKVNRLLVDKLYMAIVSQLFGKDEILHLRSSESKSSSEKFYEKKGYVNSLMFDIFDPLKKKDITTKNYIYAFVQYQKNNSSNPFNNLSIIHPSNEPYFKLSFSNNPTNKQEFIDKIKEFSTELNIENLELINISKIFILLSSEITFFLVPIKPIPKLNLLKKSKYIDYIKVNESNNLANFMKTLKYFGIKPFEHLIT